MRGLVGSLALGLAVATAAVAHEKGRLRVAEQRLAPGATVAVSGAKFGKGEVYQMLLVGTAGRTKLLDVTTDAQGAFSGSIVVPAGAAAGAYRLVLEASDNDEAASLDVEVMPASAAQAASGEHHHEEGAAHEHSGDAPSAEPLKLDRARSPLVRGGALASAALAFAVGIFLLRRPHA